MQTHCTHTYSLECASCKQLNRIKALVQSDGPTSCQYLITYNEFEHTVLNERETKHPKQSVTLYVSRHDLIWLINNQITATSITGSRSPISFVAAYQNIKF